MDKLQKGGRNLRVFVINQRKEPLMPTTPRKARVLLEEGKAKVIKAKPFTIQLIYSTGETKQEVTLGIDSGYQNVGLSAITEKAELLSAEVKLLIGQKERLKEKAMYRGQRRSRKRHRKPRFDNRRIPKGWLAPSIQHKLDSHLRLVDLIRGVLPIANIIIEVANFDIQKIKNPEIEGKEYQEGEQLGYWNLREYILHRDNHKCQNPNCKNKSKEQILGVHHLGYYEKDRSNRPSNLITLCNKCHTPRNHQESSFLWGWKPKLKSFRAETFMSMVRWRLVNSLECEHTYGYLTKSKRIELGIEKSHSNDAFVIAGGTKQEKVSPLEITQIRRNNRSLEKFYDAKYIDTRTGRKASGKELFSGRTTRNKNLSGENLRTYRGEKQSKGRRSIRKQRYFYQPKDIVKLENKKYQVAGMQNKGAYIKLKDLTKVVKVDLVKPYRFSGGFSIA